MEIKAGNSTCTAVTLADMLNAREKRVKRQMEMLEKSRTIISFTLNIPGPVKRFNLALKAFETGRTEIENQLKRNNINISKFLLTDENTGVEGIWTVEADGKSLKKLMVAIDEYHPLGRLFDIDVITKGGAKVERSSLGLSERRCLICHRPVSQCAGSRRHSAEELYKATVAIMENFYLESFCNQLASTAVRSLLYEVSIGPKPGLVDRFNNGSHSDMDIFTFIDSSVVLNSYFKEITKSAYGFKNVPAKELMQHLQYSGLMAEEKMYGATKGVNTHKGAIYSLGIICAAYGYAFDFSNNYDLDLILKLCADIGANSTYNHILANKIHTNGEKIYLKHNLKGARGEVAAGFPTVKQFSLPAFVQKYESGWSVNNAALYALLVLMANVDDTNIIARSDIEVLRSVQLKIGEILSAPDITEDDIVYYCGKLNQEFVRLNISPGGSADLLSVTLMLYFLNGK